MKTRILFGLLLLSLTANAYFLVRNIYSDQHAVFENLLHRDEQVRKLQQRLQQELAHAQAQSANKTGTP